MLSRILLALIFISLFGCQTTSTTAQESKDTKPSLKDVLQKPIVIPQVKVEGRKNTKATLKKPYVVMVSIDGFRHDYIEKYDALSLIDIEAKGRRAEALIPSNPTKTFPNHYTIVTGLYPAHHGIIDNHFYDPKLQKFYSKSDPFSVTDPQWYGGDPIWSAAERSGILAASYFWVGSETKIAGYLPTYYYKYTDLADNDERVRQIGEWLKLPEEVRPHLLTLYFSLVDNSGHSYGPKAQETRVAVQKADALIAKLRTLIKDSGLPVNLIITSDHGMIEVDKTKIINVADVLNKEKVESTGSDGFVFVHVKDKSYLKEAYEKLKMIPNVQVHYNKELPKEWNMSGQSRFGDIIVSSKIGEYLITRPLKNVNTLVASHGWHNSNKEMWGIFLAEGPNIKKGLRLSPFENIHVYPFIAKILGIKIKGKIDGKSEVLSDIYKR